jgi:hypothetical protein
MTQFATIPARATQEVSRPVTVSKPRLNLTRMQQFVKELNAELPSLKEFILWLKDPKNYEKAQSDWYYMRDNPLLKIHGPCKIDYENATLVAISEKEFNNLRRENKKQTAWVFASDDSMALAVDSKVDRYIWSLDSSGGPGFSARVAYVPLIFSQPAEISVQSSTGIAIIDRLFASNPNQSIVVTAIEKMEGIGDKVRFFDAYVEYLEKIHPNYPKDLNREEARNTIQEKLIEKYGQQEVVNPKIGDLKLWRMVLLNSEFSEYTKREDISHLERK